MAQEHNQIACFNEFLFREKVDKNAEDWEENWETVIYRYEVTDNLGNEYKVIPNGAWGNGGATMSARLITNQLSENATSLTITPIASIYKFIIEGAEDGEMGREMELAKGPIRMEAIEVPLDEN